MKRKPSMKIKLRRARCKEVLVILLNRVETLELSSDWGATWRPVTSLTNYNGWGSVTCSADGETLALFLPFKGRRLLLSTNAGATWSTTEMPSPTNLCSLACAADGSRVVAALGHVFFGEYPSVYVRQTTSAPRLEVRTRPGYLELSWVVPSEPFVLQESPDLAAWSSVQAAPVLNYGNLYYVVNLPLPAGSRFYRLASH